MIRALVFSAIMASVLALAACGGGNDKPAAATAANTTARTSQAGDAPGATPSPTKALKDPCSYVTREEVRTATGKAITSDGINVNDFSCRWLTSDSGSVNISVGCS